MDFDTLVGVIYAVFESRCSIKRFSKFDLLHLKKCIDLELHRRKIGEL